MARAVTAASQSARGVNLREEALLMLDRRGALLDVARELSDILRSAGIPGVVIGGVAVVLHGHVRTTNDVDLMLQPPLEPLADLLSAHGFAFDPGKKESMKKGVPVHPVLTDQVGALPAEVTRIEGITTVTLADLIDMKLRSGTADLLRAQDVADVIGLIRHHRLNSGFARHLSKPLRPAFRKLARLIEAERPKG